jgi:hypothetical protein
MRQRHRPNESLISSTQQRRCTAVSSLWVDQMISSVLVAGGTSSAIPALSMGSRVQRGRRLFAGRIDPRGVRRQDCVHEFTDRPGFLGRTVLIARMLDRQVAEPGTADRTGRIDALPTCRLRCYQSRSDGRHPLSGRGVGRAWYSGQRGYSRRNHDRRTYGRNAVGRYEGAI